MTSHEIIKELEGTELPVYVYCECCKNKMQISYVKMNTYIWFLHPKEYVLILRKCTNKYNRFLRYFKLIIK